MVVGIGSIVGIGCWKGILGIWCIGIGVRLGESLLDVEVHPDGVAAVTPATEEGASDTRLFEAETTVGVELLHHEALTDPAPTTP